MVIHTSLSANTNGNSGILASKIEVSSRANADIPTQIRDRVDCKMCLIQSCQ